MKRILVFLFLSLNLRFRGEALASKPLSLFLLIGSLTMLTWAGGCGSKTPQDVGKRTRMAGYAYYYVSEGAEWINRDGWDYDDGTVKHYRSVSYNEHEADWCHDFADKIDSSATAGQVYWSEYTSYRPGGRDADDPEAFPWAGTRCQGLAYRSAIKAGYSIDSYYLNCIGCWYALGSEVAAPQEGDLILIDFDTTNNHPNVTYEHLGVMWGMLPHILSAVAIYGSPFVYKAGTHTLQDYEEVLPVEFDPYLPPGHPGLDVYNWTYIRLPE